MEAALGGKTGATEIFAKLLSSIEKIRSNEDIRPLKGEGEDGLANIFAKTARVDDEAAGRLGVRIYTNALAMCIAEAIKGKNIVDKIPEFLPRLEGNEKGGTNPDLYTKWAYGKDFGDVLLTGLPKADFSDCRKVVEKIRATLNATNGHGISRVHRILYASLVMQWAPGSLTFSWHNAGTHARADSRGNRIPITGHLLDGTPYKLEEVPHHGRDFGAWSEGTLEDWIRGDKSANATRADADCILRHLANLANRLLPHPLQDADEFLNTIIAPCETDRERLVETLVGRLLPTVPLIDLKARQAPEPDVEDVFSSAMSEGIRKLLEGKGLTHPKNELDPLWTCLNGIGSKEKARQVELRGISPAVVDEEEARVRSVVIAGPNESGKRMLLRIFIERLGAEQYLRVADNSVPLLFVDLERYSADEFIDKVYKFYTRRKPESFQHATTQLEKLARLPQLARETPVCALLAGWEALEHNELIRAMCADCVGDFIGAVINGHRCNRLVVTTTSADHVAKQLLGESYCESIRTSELKVREVCQILGLEPSGDASLDADVSSLTFALTQATMALAARLPLLGHNYVKIECGGRLSWNDSESIAKLLFTRVLTPAERLIVGYVASSEDGTRYSVLKKMLAATAKAYSSRNIQSMVPELGAVDLERELDGLLPVITKISNARVEPLLGEPDEDLYRIAGEHIRRTLLRRWHETDPEASSFGHWLIAREAARQSRVMRIRQVLPGPRCFFRDTQMIRALLAFTGGARPSIGRRSGTSFGETEILPPLEEDAALPSAEQVLRYALLVYRDDIEGGSYNLVASRDEARARVNVLARFLTQRLPYQALEQLGLPLELRHDALIRRVFSHAEICDLMASLAIGAGRINEYGLLKRVCVLGRQLFDEGHDDPATLMHYLRLFRAEVDASLLLGHTLRFLREPNQQQVQQVMPGETPVTVEDETLSGVIRDLEHLLTNDFAAGSGSPAGRELLLARGKLWARLAEAYHLRGGENDIRSAAIAARNAELMERAVAVAGGRATLSPVLGGRGARAIIRLSVDIARRYRFGRAPLMVEFSCGLKLPFPPDLRQPNSKEKLWIEQGRRYLDINLRRQSRGRLVDAIGNQLDAAWFHLLRHQFLDALKALGTAGEKAYGGNSYLELQMELMVVWIRALLDTAIVCLLVAEGAKGRVLPTPEAIRDLGRHLSAHPLQQQADMRQAPQPDAGGDPGSEQSTVAPVPSVDAGPEAHPARVRSGQPLDVARRLHQEAISKLNALNRILGAHNQVTRNRRGYAQPRFMRHAQYLEVLSKLLGIALAETGKGHGATASDQSAGVRWAADRLSGVIEGMKLGQYKLFVPEAEGVLRALEAFVQRA